MDGPKPRFDIVGFHAWALCTGCENYYVMYDRNTGKKIGICPQCDGNFSNANPERTNEDCVPE